MKSYRLCLVIISILFTLPVESFGETGWTQINTIQTHPLNIEDIFFADSLNGWATNRWGTDSSTWIFCTKDGGMTWSNQIVPTNRILTRVRFFNGVGFCIGFYGTILKTIDGGQHWIAKQSNTTQDLNSIFFVNEKLGWACGGSAILRTTDGGDTWIAQSVNLSLSGIAFVDELTGMVVGYPGAVLYTTNGGDTWTAMPPPNKSYTFRDVVYQSPYEILILGDGIARSTDAGATWNTTLTGAIYSKYAFADSKTGWVTGSKVLKTPDGGQSWDSQSDYYYGPALTTVSCIDSLHAWGTDGYKIYKTTTGGYTPVKRPYPPVPLQPANGADELPSDVKFTWSAGTTATYQMQAALDSLFQKIAFDSGIFFNWTPAATATKLQLGKEYWWRVRALNNMTPGDWSVVWKFKTTKGTLQLDAPASNAQNVKLNPTLSWSGPIGDSLFHIQVSTDSTFNGNFNTNTFVRGSSITIGPLAYNTKYYWRAAVRNGAVDGSWTAPSVFRTRGEVTGTSLLNLGTTWFYQYYSTYPGTSPSDSAYGVIKEIVDTLQSGARVVQVTRLFTGYTKTSTEYMLAANGKLFHSINAAISTADAPIYDPGIQKDSTVYSNGYYGGLWYRPFTATVFNSQVLALKKYFTAGGKSGSRSENFISTLEFGSIQENIIEYWTSTRIQDDSMVIVGLLKNGLCFGDTTVIDYRRRTPALQTPAKGASNVCVSPTFTWSNAAAAISYRIQISTDPQFASAAFDDSLLAQSSKLVNGLKASTTYYWRVLAVAKDQRRYWSPTWDFTTEADPKRVAAALFPPDGSVNTQPAMTFYWKKADSTNSYKIEFYTDPAFQWTALVKITTDTSIFVNELDLAKTYYWRVVALGTDGKSNYSPMCRFNTMVNPAYAPSLVSPLNGSADASETPMLSWQKTAGVSSYRLQVSSHPIFALSVIDDSTVTDTAKVVRGLKAKATYKWRVQSIRPGGTFWSPIWSFTTGDHIVVPDTSKPDVVPTEFALEQNYPNPFNPTTRIRYAVSTQSLVTLTVYDQLGREVETLTNMIHQPGTYVIDYSPRHLASGLYFYRIRMGNFMRTLKMVFVK